MVLRSVREILCGASPSKDEVTAAEFELLSLDAPLPLTLSTQMAMRMKVNATRGVMAHSLVLYLEICRPSWLKLTITSYERQR